METQTAAVMHHPFAIAFSLGIVMAFIWSAAIACLSIWNRVWAWIDDQEKHKDNQVVHWIMEKLGFTKDRESDCYPWQRNAGAGLGDISSGSIAFVAPFFACMAIPSMVLAMLYAYPVTIGAFTIYLLARLARFARRHKKLFDKHIADPNAHK